MILREFNRLSKEEQIKTVRSIGIFLVSYKSETETLNCYAVDKFFVECLYDKYKIRTIGLRSFKSGRSLDKYSPNFKTEY